MQSASAKAGQFSKLDIFSVVGEPAISSPYQPGGPKAGADATFELAAVSGKARDLWVLGGRGAVPDAKRSTKDDF